MEGYGTGKSSSKVLETSPLIASIIETDAYIHLNKLSSSAEPLQ